MFSPDRLTTNRVTVPSLASQRQQRPTFPTPLIRVLSSDRFDDKPSYHATIGLSLYVFCLLSPFRLPSQIVFRLASASRPPASRFSCAFSVFWDRGPSLFDLLVNSLLAAPV